ncbi:MAG: CRISPR-associated protein Cas4 [Candidatus Altiarchaeota archaeon]|nr:CRISPR-associated protein Cas4 [Candidatus Altiarchaeota archaeon]
MNNKTYVVVSDVIEYNFCPRFIYFMYCLDIPQHEGARFKVRKGREIHKVREKTNRDYLRKRLNVVRKEVDVLLTSKKNHYKGLVDEILFLDDGTAAAMDYKFAEYQDKTFRTHKYQAVLYGELIRENYGIDVERAYICYTRSNNKVKEIRFTDRDKRTALDMVQEVLQIIQTGFYPKKTRYTIKCIDCCYRNICV